MKKQLSNEREAASTPTMFNSLDDIKRLKNFCADYPDVATEPQIRWQLFNRETNGLSESGAVFKRGGCWYVCVPRYRDWITSGET